MTASPPADPARQHQVVHDQATGYQGGRHEHHHYYYNGGDPADLAVRASRDATDRGAILGPPITDWNPADLGVHASITVHDEAALTPYLPRPHDQQLRNILGALTTPDAVTRLVLVVGTSCTGKTRALYEAVQAVLPDWQLASPARTSTSLGSCSVGPPHGRSSG